jgi:hypothetical protein
MVRIIYCHFKTYFFAVNYYYWYYFIRIDRYRSPIITILWKSYLHRKTFFSNLSLIKHHGHLEIYWDLFCYSTIDNFKSLIRYYTKNILFMKILFIKVIWSDLYNFDNYYVHIFIIDFMILLLCLFLFINCDFFYFLSKLLKFASDFDSNLHFIFLTIENLHLPFFKKP